MSNQNATAWLLQEMNKADDMESAKSFGGIGNIVGSVLGAVAGSFLGNPILGWQVGSTLGSLGGSQFDEAGGGSGPSAPPPGAPQTAVQAVGSAWQDASEQDSGWLSPGGVLDKAGLVSSLASSAAGFVQPFTGAAGAAKPPAFIDGQLASADLVKYPGVSQLGSVGAVGPSVLPLAGAAPAVSTAGAAGTASAAGTAANVPKALSTLPKPPATAAEFVQGFKGGPTDVASKLKSELFTVPQPPPASPVVPTAAPVVPTVPQPLSYAPAGTAQPLAVTGPYGNIPTASQSWVPTTPMGVNSGPTLQSWAVNPNMPDIPFLRRLQFVNPYANYLPFLQPKPGVGDLLNRAYIP